MGSSYCGHFQLSRPGVITRGKCKFVQQQQKKKTGFFLGGEEEGVGGVFFFDDIALLVNASSVFTVI